MHPCPLDLQVCHAASLIASRQAAYMYQPVWHGDAQLQNLGSNVPTSALVADATRLLEVRKVFVHV